MDLVTYDFKGNHIYFFESNNIVGLSFVTFVCPLRARGSAHLSVNRLFSSFISKFIPFAFILIVCMIMIRTSVNLFYRFAMPPMFISVSSFDFNGM